MKFYSSGLVDCICCTYVVPLMMLDVLVSKVIWGLFSALSKCSATLTIPGHRAQPIEVWDLCSAGNTYMGYSWPSNFQVHVRSSSSLTLYQGISVLIWKCYLLLSSSRVYNIPPWKQVKRTKELGVYYFLAKTLSKY